MLTDNAYKELVITEIKKSLNTLKDKINLLNTIKNNENTEHDEEVEMQEFSILFDGLFTKISCFLDTLKKEEEHYKQEVSDYIKQVNELHKELTELKTKMNLGSEGKSRGLFSKFFHAVIDNKMTLFMLCGIIVFVIYTITTYFFGPEHTDGFSKFLSGIFGKATK